MQKVRILKKLAGRALSVAVIAGMVVPMINPCGIITALAKGEGVEKYSMYSDTADLLDVRLERVRIIGDMTEWGSESDIREIWDELNGYADEYDTLADDFNTYAKLASLAGETGYTAENVALVDGVYAEYKDTARIAPDGEHIYVIWTDRDKDGKSEATYFLNPAGDSVIITDSEGNISNDEPDITLYENIAFIGGDAVEGREEGTGLRASYDADRDGGKESVIVHIGNEGVQLSTSSGAAYTDENGHVAVYPETAGELSRRIASKLSTLKEEIKEAEANLKLAEAGLKEREEKEENSRVVSGDGTSAFENQSGSGEYVYTPGTYSSGGEGENNSSKPVTEGTTGTVEEENNEGEEEKEESPNSKVVVNESLDVLKSAMEEETLIDDTKISTGSYNYKSGYQTGFEAGKTYMTVLGASASEPEEFMSEGGGVEVLKSGNSYAEGWKDGYDEGFSEGKKEATSEAGSSYADGYKKGYDEGVSDGYTEGYKKAEAEHASDSNSGFAEGYDQGYNEGFTDGEASGKAGRTLDTEVNVASMSYSSGYTTGVKDGYTQAMAELGMGTGTGDGISTTSTETAALKAQIEALTKEVESLTSKNTSMATEITALTTANTKLSGQLETQKDSLKDLKDDVKDLEEDNSDLSKSNKDLKSSNSDLSGKLTSISNELESVKKDNSSLTGKIDSLNGEMTSLTSTNKNLSDKNTDLESHNADLETRIQTLEEKSQMNAAVSENKPENNLSQAAEELKTVELPDNNPFTGITKISYIGKDTLKGNPGTEETADNFTGLSPNAEYKGTITKSGGSTIAETSKDDRVKANKLFAYYTDTANLASIVTEPEYKEQLLSPGAKVKMTALTSIDVDPTVEQQETIKKGHTVDYTINASGMKEGNVYLLLHQSNTRASSYDVILTRATSNGLTVELPDLSPISIAEVEIVDKEEKSIVLEGDDIGEYAAPDTGDDSGILWKEDEKEPVNNGINLKGILVMVLFILIVVAGLFFLVVKPILDKTKGGSSGNGGALGKLMSIIPGKKNDTAENEDDEDDDEL